ncbi:MAG: hypothetical protein EXR47_02025 [Dehalococcoidia bacterium]|nr:hypothetical protein [Dehalococcoidia bacterium]
MGVFRHPIEVGDPAGRRFETVDAVVDTGASFTVVPGAVLRRLGIVPQRTVSFRLANGTVMEREVGETVVRIGGNRATRMVVFGGESDPALLGADTLEGLLLGVDPVAKRLVPAEAYLLFDQVRRP